MANLNSVMRLTLTLVILQHIFASHELLGRFESRLILKLLDNDRYSNQARPAANETTPVKVYMQMAVRQLLELSLPQQFVRFQSWLRFYWRDVLLAWNPADYANLTEIRLDTRYIWTPDITIYNTMAEKPDPVGMLVSRAAISHTGKVALLMPHIITATCKVAIQRFPYDRQKCEIIFGSWTYDTGSLDMIPLSDRGDMSQYQTHNVLALETIIAERRAQFYPCCVNSFVTLHYTLVFQRLPLYYLINFIIPCGVLAVLSCFVFLIPIEAGEKLSYPVTLLLGMSVFQLLFVEYLPATSIDTPQLTVFFGVMILQLGIETFLEILMIMMYHKGEYGDPLPRWLKVVCFHYIAVITCKKKAADRLLIQDAEISTTVSESPTIEPYKTRRRRPTVFDQNNDATRSTFNYCNSKGGHTNDTAYIYSKPMEYVRPKEHEILEIMLRESQHDRNRRNFRDTCIDQADLVRKQWNFSVYVLDRLFFYLFFLLTLVCIGVFFANQPGKD